MAITKVSRGLLNTGISDSSNATAITIDSSENVGIGTTTINTGTLGTSNKFLEVAAGTASGSGTLVLSRDTSGNDNEIGGIRFVNANNADDDGLDADGKFVAAIAARSVTSDSNASDDSGANLVFYTKPEAGNYAERMRIDSSGNVTFNGHLTINNTSSDRKLAINRTGGKNFSIEHDTAGFYIYNTTDSSLHTRFTNAGDVVIGAGTTRTGTQSLSLEQANSYIQFRQTGAQGVAQIQFFRNTDSSATYAGGISTTGTSVTYSTSSDYRLKENVDYNFDALDRVKQLKPARFNFITDADTTVDGFIAHEVSDIVPEAVTGEKDAVKQEEYEITPAEFNDDGEIVTEAVMGTREVPDYQGIDQSKLVPLLTKAIQEQQEQIEALQSEINTLKGD